MIKLLQRVKELEDILFDEDFWRDMRREVMKVALPVFREVFLMGAEVGAEVRPVRRKAAEIPFDPDAINAAADAVFSGYMDEWWARLDTTQREGLRKATEIARREGTGVEGVMAGIEGLFSPARMMTIATTETTRLFGLGALATYRAAGMTAWQWRTVADARVDPICEGRAGDQYPITVDFSPAHPSCRCFPVPVYEAA